MDPVSVEPRDMPFRLLEEITENFSEQRKLGSGAYGKVYMGVLNGEKIAVKVLHESLQLDDHKQQFQKEFENLASLQHPNIIRLLGYCYETRKKYVNHNGDLVFANKIDRALCFEYMHKKSLDKYLDDDNIGLDWHTSYAIIKGISNGLKYLHEELKPPMYHLDLKPANILLDDNMVPKVADFGLSRLIREEHTRITTSPVGTTGYLPPEYIKHQAISNKFDIFSLGVIIIKIMAGPTGYSQSTEICSQEFIELVHGSWRNRLHAASANALDSYCKQVKRCIEIALRSVDVDRHKRPTIGDIVHELNETETMCPFPYALRNNPASRMEQESHRTHIIEVEEKKAREEIREIENCFGEIVDNYKLEKMASYTGRPKTLEQRAREAWNLVSENDKDGKASRYVDGLKAMYGNGQSTLCLVYNATGGTLCQVANHDWYGYIGSASYPAKIGNGQWAAFHHVHRTGEPSGSVGSIVYRGKNRDGQDQDYLVSWSTPWGFYYRNKAYCEIGGVDYFQKRWSSTYHKLINSDYSSNARSDGCEVEAKIGTGDSPKFIARITSR